MDQSGVDDFGSVAKEMPFGWNKGQLHHLTEQESGNDRSGKDRDVESDDGWERQLVGLRLKV